MAGCQVCKCNLRMVINFALVATNDVVLAMESQFNASRHSAIITTQVLTPDTSSGADPRLIHSSEGCPIVVFWQVQAAR